MVAFDRRQEDDRGAAPVVDEEVHPAVAVVVAGHAAHRSHGRVVGQRRRVEHERRELVCRRRRRRVRDDHVVGPRIDDAHAVGQAMTGYVGHRDAGAHRRDPRHQVLIGAVHLADRLSRVVSRRHRDRHALELVRRRDRVEAGDGVGSCATTKRTARTMMAIAAAGNETAQPDNIQK